MCCAFKITSISFMFGKIINQFFFFHEYQIYIISNLSAQDSHAYTKHKNEETKENYLVFAYEETRLRMQTCIFQRHREFVFTVHCPQEV